jgi:peptidyl-prolyl cis-trans isomerase D
MLQKMGEHIHGWIAGIIVVVISIIFALFGVSYYLHAGNPGDVVLAKVNGEKLTAQMLQTSYTNATRTNPSLALASPEKRIAFKKQLLDQWVKRQAIVTSLKQANMLVSPDVVRSLLIANPAFHMNGSFSAELFQQFLMNQNMTENQFYQNFSSQLASSQFVQAIAQNTFVLPKATQHYFKVLTQQRTYRYALIQIGDFESQVHTTVAALKTYYQKHLADYKAPETVSVNYIELSLNDLMNQIQIDPAQVKSYYQNHMKSFTQFKSWNFVTFSVSDLRSKYLKDTNAQINKRFTDQVNALKAGQDIAGFLKQHKPETKTSADLNPKVVKLFNALKPGQVSKVQNDDILKGKMVYFLVSVKPKHIQSFASVKDKVLDHLKKQQLNALLSSKSDQMTSLAYSNPEGLAQAAKVMGLTVQTTPVFTRQGLKNGPASAAKFIAAAFGDTVLTQGVNSDPITLPDGSVVIMHVNKHHPAYDKPFAEVKVDVQKAYTQVAAKTLAEQHALKLSDQLNNHQNVLMNWKNVSMASIGDKSVSQAISKAAFDKPFAVGGKPVAFMVPVSDKQIAVVQLQSLHLMSMDQMTKQQSQHVQKRLISLQQMAALKMVQNSLYQHSKIQTHKDKIS